MPPYPVASVDYPADWMAFRQWFFSDEACAVYLAKLRWSKGFACPLCRSTEGWPSKDKLNMYCKRCGRRISVTAGTAFDSSKKGLLTWFTAAWFLTSRKNGISALALQKDLGLGSYQTAWAWLHKLRRAMVRPGRDKLHGEIEVDETLVGGAEEGVKGRQTESKVLVLVLVEKRGVGMGRVRLVPIVNAGAAELKRAIEATVREGSIIHTDNWKGYTDKPNPKKPKRVIALDPAKYTHVVSTISGSGKKAHELLPRVHRIASLLKRVILGTHQGAIRPEHLAFYLDEFCFRFNRRESKRRGLLFYRLIEQALMVDATPYEKLLNPDRKPQHRKVTPSFKKAKPSQLLAAVP